MNALCHCLAEHGGGLLAAATGLLAIGCAGMALQRSPIHRQRAGETAILGVLVWLILACVPLPRYRLWDLWPSGWGASSEAQPAQTADSPAVVLEPISEPILAEVTAEEVSPMPTNVLPPVVGVADGGGGVAAAMLPEVPDSPTVVEPEPPPSTKALQAAPDEDRNPGRVDRAWPAWVAPAFDVGYVLSMAYVAGAVACLVWLALGRVLLVRMLWSARPPEPWLREVYRRLPFGRRQRPRLLISDRCRRALSFGIWRPTLVLPGDACRADRAEGLRYVLLHELAHARQRDGWGHLLFNVAFPLLYFHPLYWWIRSRAYLAAELIADDWAAGRTAKESYVEALIALAKGGGHLQLAYASSLQIFRSRSQFYRRMQMLLDRKNRLARRCSPLWCLIYPAACVLAVLLVAGTVGVPPAEAQPDELAAPGADVVAEPTPPREGTAEPAVAVEPAVEVNSEAVALPPKPEPSGGWEGARLRQKRDLLRAERDQLEKQLKDLAAAVAELKKELEALKAERVVGPRRVDRYALPAAPPQPTPPGAAPTSAAAPTAAPAPPGALASPPPWALPTPVVKPPSPGSVGRPAGLFGAGAEPRAPEGTQLDLVSLATSSVNAAGELEITKLEFEGRKQLAKQTHIPAQELAIAEIKFKTAERKVAVLRSIAESALVETKAEMEAAKSQLESLAKEQPRDRSALRAAEAQLIRAQSRLRVLESILASGGR
jgi:beta-lactamase regulating signal transducer with metallopeptidase domain